ncbi:hypothetical protein B0T20DRAFT_346934 [Sordaria brevicollis]|uniref:Uncharacterized protein n=1 Tax=Sordaria brevicollis TaxID=83679 RepID=A0AAE0PLU0_SORBR|nr:hypothetical protein B0T20DRAFT_346934 [Sordaria brevicollis]
MPTEAKFLGYRPFPPVMNLYGNSSGGVMGALTTYKLCGTDKDDFLYVVEVHHGFTPRGPLNFRPGFYLRNGTGTEAPILAAAGDEEREPLLMSTFSVKSLIMVPPPLDEDDVEFNLNPRDLVTEIMYATKTSDGVSFRFSVEVGPKMKVREEFEWRKTVPRKGETNGSQHARYILVRLPPSSVSSPSSTPASSSLSPPAQEESDILADLTFRNAMSLNHIFTLELKGAACSGVMGDRWTLTVVTTALRLYWLRIYGKTNKAVVGIGQKLRGK